MAFDNYNNNNYYYCLPSDQIICIFSWELYIFETVTKIFLLRLKKENNPWVWGDSSLKLNVQQKSEMSSWTQHHFVSCINTSLTRSQLYSLFQKENSLPWRWCASTWLPKSNTRKMVVMFYMCKNGCSEWWKSL